MAHPLQKDWLVLIVDDHGYMRTMVRSLLEQMGIKKVEEFEECRKAYYRLQQHDAPIPQAIILDWHMEDMDGYEFADSVRKDPAVRAKHIPIVVLTGERDTFMLDQLRDMGVKAILNKPVGLQQLQDALVKAVTGISKR